MNLFSDTIAAVATPSGRGGIAVIRVSGPDALTMAGTVVTTTAGLAASGRRLIRGRIADTGGPVDDVLVCYMAAPRSFTGEDTVEIHCHGGGAVSTAILDLLYRTGVRPAGPGEFTRRAFENGRMDLAQAEAVMEVIAAQTRAHLTTAQTLLSGTFSRTVTDLLDRIVDCRATLDAAVDFGDDDSSDSIEIDISPSLAAIRDAITPLVASRASSRLVRSGVTVVISGTVNAGKSTLFNALVGHGRAIVSDTPGTTRDWIEERLLIDDVPIVLIDTAGIRDTADHIEHTGMAHSRRLQEEADIILHIFDVSRADVMCITPPENTATILVAAQCDRLPEFPALPRDLPDAALPVSAKTGFGMDALRSELTTKARGIIAAAENTASVIVERHHAALTGALAALERTMTAMGSSSIDAAAYELARAQSHLEAIVGTNVAPDVLDRIFSRFCIGK